MAAKKTKEEAAHEARLVARRNRRARKKAEAEREMSAAMEQAAENARSDEVAKPAPAAIKPAVLGVKQQVIAASTSPRRITEARENLSIAFEQLGGIPSLVAWGLKNPTEFYRIWARLIPKEIPQDPSKTMPLEDLLSKLSERAEMSVAEAAMQIGEEALSEAAEQVNLEDAVAAFEGSVH